MPTLTIKGFPVSTWVRTACMAAVEKGVDYELLPLEYGSDAHLALHPFAKMPVLQHGGKVIAESLAIVNYIDEAFEGPALQPSEEDGRVLMWEWMSLCSDYVYRQVVRGVPRNRRASAEELATAALVLGRVDSRLGGGPFLCGERITLADLYLAPQVSNAREKAPELLDPLAGLRAWLERIERRPSFQVTSYDPAAL